MRTGAGAAEDGGRRLAAGYVGRLTAFGAAWGLALVSLLLLFSWGMWRGFDSQAYWSAWQHGLYQPGAIVGQHTYLYSPAFAQAIWPLTLLPFDLFHAVSVAAALAAYAWLLAPLRLSLRLPLLIACIYPAVLGNIEWAMALVAVLAVRYPISWALPLLTKVTPGIGLIWYAARREWRSLSLTALTTAGIAVVSYLTVPLLWASWIGLLSANQGHSYFFATFGAPAIPLIVRVPVTAAIVAWGGIHGQRWTLAVPFLLATPDADLPTLAVLTAMPRLRRSY